MKCSDFTLLFADDNSEMLALYKKAFTRDGYRVLVCENVAEVLITIRKTQVDLLVTDLMMPDTKSLALFPILKEMHPGLPVVVVSGYCENLKEGVLSRKNSVVDFLDKPVDLSFLKNKVSGILKIDPDPNLANGANPQA